MIPSQSASTLDSVTGLSLNLNLTTNYNRWVIVTAYELNTLDRANNVSLADRWPKEAYMFQWFRWTQDYCAFYPVVGYEILEGNYGLNNFTNGIPLWLQPFQGLQVQCPVPGAPPDLYTFKPLGEANVVSGEFVGSWTGPPQILNGEPTYAPFAPGPYTVVASDEWGQVVILHFTIQV